VFDHAEARDALHARTWVVLVDENPQPPLSPSGI
jgi:hypothetical protein